MKGFVLGLVLIERHNARELGNGLLCLFAEERNNRAEGASVQSCEPLGRQIKHLWKIHWVKCYGKQRHQKFHPFVVCKRRKNVSLL